MEHFAGLDVSMEETHVCVIDREGKVILEVRTPTVRKHRRRLGDRSGP
jgi:transposase